jgi:hypothetical protein
MATGIVSIAAALAALVVAAIVRLRADFDDVDVPLQLFTFVAACRPSRTQLLG